jgi:hypothetical protein
MFPKTFELVFAIALTVSALGSAAIAAPTLVNGSFEAPVVAVDGAYADNTLPTGWLSGSYFGGGTPGTANPFAGDVAPLNGNQFAYLYDGGPDLGSPGGSAPFLWQNLGTADPGYFYSLSALVGDLNRPTSPFQNNFPNGGASINLHVGSTAIIDRVATAFIPSSPGNGVAGLFATPSWFSGTGGQQLFVTLVIDGAATTGELEIASFDNVVLNQQALPEPSTLAMFAGIGLVLIVCGARRFASRPTAGV